ncbi:ribosome recycling factor [Verrucomicrobia bacterium]|nr:ribosome recycling factor [Verrucomicrobiota bacterium]
MPIDEILMEAEESMGKAEDATVRDFSGVRTGKASGALVENIMVEAYGSQMKLRDVAGISTPEARTIAIQPYDISTIQFIEKAIMCSSLGITPTSDGKLIRLFMPEMTEERRQELVKIVKKMAEDGRISVRHARREALDQLKKEKKEGTSEDEVAHAEKEVQKLTDKSIGKIEEQFGKKEKEIMTV